MESEASKTMTDVNIILHTSVAPTYCTVIGDNLTVDAAHTVCLTPSVLGFDSRAPLHGEDLDKWIAFREDIHAVINKHNPTLLQNHENN